MKLIDRLFQQLRHRFDRIKDHRTGANIQYQLWDVLMSSFALFSQKDSSLLQFIQNFKGRSNNLRDIYGAKNVRVTMECVKFWMALLPNQLALF
jgi:hypothetical protein